MIGRAVFWCLLAIAGFDAVQGDAAEPASVFANVSWEVACKDFVSGGLTAFFDGHLDKEELDCLSTDISEMVGDVVAAIKELAQSITDAIVASQPSEPISTTGTTPSPYMSDVYATTTPPAAHGGQSKGHHKWKQHHGGHHKSGGGSGSTTYPAVEEATGVAERRLATMYPGGGQADITPTYSPYGSGEGGVEVAASSEASSVMVTTAAAMETTSMSVGLPGSQEEPVAPGEPHGTPLGLSLALEIPQLLGALSKITTLYQTLSGECVKSDLKKELKIAGDNLKNGSHIGSQIFINGANLTMDLNDAIEEFRKEKFDECGFHIGMLLRKVVLETSKLPPGGPPNKDEIVQLTAGLLEGLAGGYVFEVKKTGHSAALELDFGKCLGDNTKTLALLWNNIYDLVRELSTKPKPSKDATAPAGLEGWQTLISNLLVQLPEMLSSCGLTADVINMLSDGSTAVQKSFNLALPEVRQSWDDIQSRLDAAVKKFGDDEWEDFGRDLGKVVQGFILIWIPEQYYKGVSGELRRYDADMQHQNTQLSHGVVAPVLLVSMITLLVAFALRKQLSSCKTSSSRNDDWDGSDAEAATLVDVSPQE